MAKPRNGDRKQPDNRRAENTQQDDTMNCGLSIAERSVLLTKLGDMPDTMPPRVVWNRISEQARGEGLLSGSKRQEKFKWILGAALAASVALVVLRFPPVTAPQIEPQVFPTEPSIEDVSANNGLRTVNALMVRSRQLENDLRALPAQPRLVRAGTAATISALEDSISEIDYRLNHPGIRLSPQQAHGYWRERVRLMNSLVQLRYAQVQRSSF
jgi:hypothetical protein